MFCPEGKQQGECPLSPLWLNTVLKVLGSAVRQGKRNKGVHIDYSKKKNTKNF